VNINLSIELPDDVTAKTVAAYLLQCAQDAAGQLEESIINIPEIDEQIMIDMQDDCECILFRSE
jgi:hypothetical protein